MLVLEGLDGLHRTVQLQLFSVTGLGIGLDYHDIESFALETSRDHLKDHMDHSLVWLTEPSSVSPLSEPRAEAQWVPGLSAAPLCVALCLCIAEFPCGITRPRGHPLALPPVEVAWWPILCAVCPAVLLSHINSCRSIFAEY